MLLKLQKRINRGIIHQTFQSVSKYLILIFCWDLMQIPGRKCQWVLICPLSRHLAFFTRFNFSISLHKINFFCVKNVFFFFHGKSSLSFFLSPKFSFHKSATAATGEIFTMIPLCILHSFPFILSIMDCIK